jgi:hypothetical protein
VALALTETKEGRLAIIVAIAGTVLVGGALVNVLGNNAADDVADAVRAELRTELGELPDEADLTFPVEAEPIEAGVARALDGREGRLVVVGRADDHRRLTVVVVETGWTWWLRCIKAELRGGGTVLTHVASGPC